MKLWKKFSVLAAVVLLMVTWRPAWAILVNALYDFVQISAPSNPPSGQSRLFVSSSTHQLSCLNSDGSSCAPSGGGGGGFIQPLTAPVPGSFSNLNFNVGSGVTTTRFNATSPVVAITLQQDDPGHTGNTVAIQKAPVNAAFTITAGLSVSSTPGAGGLVGLWLSDGGSNGIVFGSYNQQEWFIISITSLTNSGGGATALYTGSPIMLTGPLQWIRIQETASARSFFLSADGVTWPLTPIFTESNTAQFTTADYGIGEFMFNSGGTVQEAMYSFAETTP